MPNSVLWVCLVAVWLFVLVPMVISKGRPQVRKSTVVATSTRTLHRGGARASAGRKKPGAHPSDPAHKPSRTPSATAIALLEKKEAEIRAAEAGTDVTDEAGDDDTACDDTGSAGTEDDAVAAGSGDIAAVALETVDTETVVAETVDAGTVDADAADAETGTGATAELIVTTVGIDPVAAATGNPPDTETDDAADEYYESTEAVETESGDPADQPDPDHELDDLGDPEPADDLEEDLIDDDLLAEARPGPARVEQAPVTTAAPRRVSPSRSRESLVDKHSEARYKERQRVLLGLIGLLLGSIVSGFVLGLIGWVVMILVTVSLIAYLAFLRRAVVREQQAKAQRQARAARLRREEARRREQEEQQSRLRPVVPEPPRRRRPGGAIVLEIDDGDPVFEHLPSVPRRMSFDDTPEVDYRRAVG